MSAALIALLEGRVAPGVYWYRGRASAAAVASQAERRGWRCFHLDGREIATKRDFLQACALGLQLPDYFGNNWDALVDCLRDLAWAPAKSGYLVLYDTAERFATTNPADLAVALDILRSAVESWRTTPTPLSVLLRGIGHANVKLPRL
jgi:RNAse (barnase) inhibitor barstar